MKNKRSVVIAFIALFFILFVTCAYSNTLSEAQTHRKQAEEYFQKHDIDKALEHLKKAIEYGDKSSSAYALVATMYRLKGMNDEARQYYTAALEAAEKELAFTKALVPKPGEDAQAIQEKIDKLVLDREYNVLLIKKSIKELESAVSVPTK
ncbi:MAG: hypothetical protein AAB221_00200 [Bacteroidota bacterium]